MTHRRSGVFFVLAALVALLVGPLAVSQPGPATAALTGKNVVLVITDDQDFRSLPGMRKLMSFPEGAWVNFSRGYINDSICCPSRASILTGQYSHHTGVVCNTCGGNLDASNTLAVWLNDAGYRTGLIGKYLNGYSGSKPPGWDSWEYGEGSVVSHTTKALSFLDNADRSPFFLYLAYTAPHSYAKPEQKYAGLPVTNDPGDPRIATTEAVYVPANALNFNTLPTDPPRWVKNQTLGSSDRNFIANERPRSQKELLSIDDGVEAVVSTLKSKGVLENTVIVFIGDNGFSWGSHRYVRKHCGSEECSRVPFLVRYPGQPNRTESRLVSNVDLASTIAEVAGVDPRLPQDGESVVPLLSNEATAWPNEELLENREGGSSKFFGVVTSGWKYNEYDNGDRELYDLSADPYELTNLGKDPAYADTRAQLSARVAALKN